jgi:hypothetical protein
MGMTLKDKFGPIVPMWCADLDESNLFLVCNRGESSYFLDTKSAALFNKSFFNSGTPIFRFKYLTKDGTYFYTGVIEADGAGLHIYKSVIVDSKGFRNYQWNEDILLYQGNQDPMQMLADAARKYAKQNGYKNLPDYIENLIES